MKRHTPTETGQFENKINKIPFRKMTRGKFNV